jgi:hypothetical protein
MKFKGDAPCVLHILSFESLTMGIFSLFASWGLSRFWVLMFEMPGRNRPTPDWDRRVTSADLEFGIWILTTGWTSMTRHAGSTRSHSWRYTYFNNIIQWLHSPVSSPSSSKHHRTPLVLWHGSPKNIQKVHSYRVLLNNSGHPLQLNFPFLERLKLKTIMYSLCLSRDSAAIWVQANVDILRIKSTQQRT